MEKKKRNPIENFGDKRGINGLDKRPQDINVTGANKGSRWNKNLLRDLATVPIDTVNNEAFNKIKLRFPEFFDGSREQNWQLFMEIKQLSLIYHKDPKVSQQAIKEVKDRIEGRSITTSVVAEVSPDIIDKRLIIEVVQPTKAVRTNELDIEDVEYDDVINERTDNEVN